VKPFLPCRSSALVLTALAGFALNCAAQVPIVQTVFTADPFPIGHDEDDAPDEGFKMNEYLCFFPTDMVNWRDIYLVFSSLNGAPFNLDWWKFE
jgi:hypothetical protein